MKRTRVFRQVVTLEVFALADSDVEVGGDLLAGADIEAIIRGAVLSRDTLAEEPYLVPGESDVGPIEELTP